jgi:methylenetetrahydrofolate dehydrogenase (NADP+)/methenyltetrahydrofolate cyclohydrolase
MSARLIEGKKIAARVEEEVREALEQLRRRGVAPSLVTVQIGENPAAKIYLRRQQGAFARQGIDFRVLSLDPGLGQDDLLGVIAELNGDPRTSGIMIQMPLPEGFNPRVVRRAIRPDKDVEGVHPENLGYLLSDRPELVPCTAAAVMEGIAETGVDLEGAEVVVVGHSETVGKPVDLLLTEKLATVTVCHHRTRDLFAHTRRAEILVVAVGRAGLITEDAIRPEAIVIDVGINRQQVGSKTRLVGDVDAGGADRRAAWRTPVPGGVGPITVAMLLRNTVLAAERLVDRP